MRRQRRRDRSLDAFSNADLVTIACSFSVAHLTNGACSFFATTVLDRAIERSQRQRQRMGGYGVYLVHCHPIKPALNRKAFPIDFILCRRSDGVGPSGFLHLAIIAILALLFDPSLHAICDCVNQYGDSGESRHLYFYPHIIIIMIIIIIIIIIIVIVKRRLKSCPLTCADWLATE